MDEYSKAHREAVATGKYWILVVTEDWCPACKSLKQGLASHLKNKDVIITYLSRDNKYAKQIAGDRIPHWFIWKYDSVNEKFKVLHEEVGSSNLKYTLNRIVKK